MLLTRRTAIVTTGASLAACAAPQPSPQETPTRAVGWSSHPPLPFAVQEIYPAGHRGRIHIAGGLLGEGGKVVGVSNRHIAYDPGAAGLAVANRVQTQSPASDTRLDRPPKGRPLRPQLGVDSASSARRCR